MIYKFQSKYSVIPSAGQILAEAKKHALGANIVSVTVDSGVLVVETNVDLTDPQISGIQTYLDGLRPDDAETYSGKEQAARITAIKAEIDAITTIAQMRTFLKKLVDNGRI